MNTDKFIKERTGIIKVNNYGSMMIIDKYESAKKVWVKFIEHNNIVRTSWDRFCEGTVKNVYDRSVFGVGFIGEGEYKSRIKGLITPQYAVWNALIQRCYNEKILNKYTTYRGCSVCNDWLNFQNFARWYDENYYDVDGEQMNLDKDILIKGNKIYSPNNCIFVPKKINLLFVKSNIKRGTLPIGVHFDKKLIKFIASCNNGKGRYIYLGCYNSPELAFVAYKSFKEKLIKQIAEEYKDKIPENLYKALVQYEVDIND